ncbi:hypothetical protein NHH03_01860 [Stieleria sp. TO1_6]|uniref:hypothetical protein n=1 Tax=Stieleria tagensis TaxID=2956795 RepID=UPI00209ACCEF|nr:hypothetical protein [Stieleria tagensis]MCO8120466.1 hypothetical protein [Stieleria tagensis]
MVVVCWTVGFDSPTSPAATPQQVAPPVETVDDATEKISLADLPSPPPTLASLIEQGDVKFVTGGQPVSNADTLPAAGRLAGETRFTFRYHYNSRARWSLIRRRGSESSDQADVQIRVRFRSIKMTTTHEVWLKDPPPPERFWDDRVVLHEFDHVRLSSDPRIEQQFRDSVDRLKSFRVALAEVAGDDGQISKVKVQALIEARMQESLSSTTEYVRIRYLELDRLTQHGLRPLPDDAGLFQTP